MGQVKRKKKKKHGCLWTIFWVLFFVILIEALAGVVMYRGMITKKAAKYLAPKIPYQKVSIKEENVEQKYYYDQLEEKEKIVYKEILQGIQELSAEIYIHSSDARRRYHHQRGTG